jgi:preprotein translocase subunit SecG
MTGLIIFIHAVICVLLIAIILMQPGKGGGLTDSMASAESIFGAKTNVFIIKTTAIFAVIFLVTCLGLAILSSQKGKSLMAERALPPVSTQQAAELREIPETPPAAQEAVTQPEPVTVAPVPVSAVEPAPAPEPAPEAVVPATQQ